MTITKGKRLTGAEISKRWRRKHPGAFRKKINDYRKRVRNAAIVVLGEVCNKCGFNDSRALQIDHIGGGGTAQLRRGSGSTYLNEVIKSVLNKENKYQLLCANCNWIKRTNNKNIEAPGRPIQNL